MPDIINVIMHGVFAYILREDFIEAYTPAVCGHVYKASGPRFSGAYDLKQGVDYSLEGVLGNPSERRKPDATCNPLLSLPSADRIDCFDKRYGMIRLPYPARIDGYSHQIYPLDAYEIGAVFAGKHCSPLNDLTNCPSLQAFVYARGKGPLRLCPVDAKQGKAIDFDSLVPKPGTVSNLHVWCTLDPQDLSMHGMTPEGHIRRAFAALVDMIPGLELTLQIPDHFSPTACAEKRPPGVSECDVDPGRKQCIDAKFGIVNCHYSNLMFWPG